MRIKKDLNRKFTATIDIKTPSGVIKKGKVFHAVDCFLEHGNPFISIKMPQGIAECGFRPKDKLSKESQLIGFFDRILLPYAPNITHITYR